MAIILAAICIGLVIGYLLIPFILLSRISSLQEEVKSLRSQLIFQLDSLSKAARTSHREPASTPPRSAQLSASHWQVQWQVCPQLPSIV